MRMTEPEIREAFLDFLRIPSVTETEGHDGRILELRVAPEDMGKVIGRQGRNAKEIRTVIRSVAQRQNEKVSVEIMD